MIRVGMIGAGQITATHSDTMAQLNGARLAGFYDVVPDRAEAMARRYGATAYSDLRAMLADVDAVFIGTPPKFHREAAVAAAEAGVAVFCEKPLADTVSDAEAIAAAVDRAGITFMVGFCFRFFPSFRKLKALMDSGVLGDVHSFFAVRMVPLPHPAPNWRTDPRFLCGMTVESLSHDFDLMRWVVGDPVSVVGTVATDRPDLDGYDNIMSAVMKLRSGGMASFHSNWVSTLSICEHGIVGTRGTAVCGGSAPLRWKTRDQETEQRDALAGPEDRVSGLVAETQHFIACLETGRPPLTSVHDGVATVRISHALLQSAREERIVKLS